MFEDSTFESTGRIRTRSRGWMLAALALNSSILLALILVPLVYPEALPRMAMSFLMQTPATPPPASPTPPRPTMRTSTASTDIFQGQVLMPRVIPTSIAMVTTPEPAAFTSLATLDTGSGTPGGVGTAFRDQAAPRVVHPAENAKAHVPSSIAAGLLLNRVVPVYPALGRAMHAEGTVELAATISKEGRIVNLRVVSGPGVLQQAALDAVSQWRYRPYLLNGEPVEVETTVDVIFRLGR